MKKDKITIQGPNGCGKSSTAKLLLEFLPGYTLHSTGTIARTMAAANNMTIEEYVVYARDNDIPFDSIIDQSLKDLNVKNKVVVESRLGYHFLPESFKVYLDIDLEIAAVRRHTQLQQMDFEKYKDLTIVQVRDMLQKRNENDREKYVQLYKTDYTDLTQYDLVINTGDPINQIGRVVGDILLQYPLWLES